MVVTTLALLDVKVVFTLLGGLVLTSGGLTGLLISTLLCGGLALASNTGTGGALLVPSGLRLGLLLLLLGVSKLCRLDATFQQVVALLFPLLELLLEPIISGLIFKLLKS